jgi:hypothetical protein
MKFFRWNEWNELKLEKHGVSIQEAEYVVQSASRPYPRRMGATNGRSLGADKVIGGCRSSTLSNWMERYLSSMQCRLQRAGEEVDRQMPKNPHGESL